jgi:hypothetical protein
MRLLRFFAAKSFDGICTGLNLFFVAKDCWAEIKESA